ncbi:MAG: dienelactone hydrolase family protein [Dongiaceae bacterium]
MRRGLACLLASALAVALCGAGTGSAGTGSAGAASRLASPAAWPAPDSVAGVAGTPVQFPSSSPFALTDAAGAEPTTAIGRLFLPPGRHPQRSVPAVIMLHGSAGVLASRELTYGPQLAALGVAALAVDSFGARRDRGVAYIDRLINITETMLMADAYAALRFLAARPEIDPQRVVLVGFSYGAMATMYAMSADVARRLAPDGLRFAGHVAFYGPCIARFEDRRTTGAPLLMLYGARDELIDPRRCAEVAADLRAGGSTVEVHAYPGAVHQWDGGWARRLIGRNLSPCRLTVERDGTIRDDDTWLPMTGTLTRKIILGLCVESRPYPIGRDDNVRQMSNRDLGRFLARVFGLTE